MQKLLVLEEIKATAYPVISADRTTKKGRKCTGSTITTETSKGPAHRLLGITYIPASTAASVTAGVTKTQEAFETWKTKSWTHTRCLPTAIRTYSSGPKTDMTTPKTKYTISFGAWSPFWKSAKLKARFTNLFRRSLHYKHSLFDLWRKCFSNHSKYPGVDRKFWKNSRTHHTTMCYWPKAKWACIEMVVFGNEILEAWHAILRAFEKASIELCFQH